MLRIIIYLAIPYCRTVCVTNTNLYIYEKLDIVIICDYLTIGLAIL